MMNKENLVIQLSQHQKNMVNLLSSAIENILRFDNLDNDKFAIDTLKSITNCTEDIIEKIQNRNGK